MLRQVSKEKIFALIALLVVITMFSFLFSNKGGGEIEPNEKWFERWIADSNCHNGCWFGIMPEQTNLEDIQKTLGADKYIDKTSIQVKFLGATKKWYINWRWRGGKSGGEIELVSTSDIYSAGVISPILYQPVSSTQIVKIFGEPDYVLTKPIFNPNKTSKYDYTLTLVYLSKGFLVLSYGVASTSENVLSSNIEFTTIDFFKPNITDLDRVVSDARLLVSWRGDQSYLYYCQQLDATRPLC